MKLFKKIVYTLLGLIMTLTIAMIGLILYSEYSGKQFFANTSGKEYADLAAPEESRLVNEEGGMAAAGTDEPPTTEVPGQNEAAPQDTAAPEAVSDTASGENAGDTAAADVVTAQPPAQADTAPAQAPADSQTASGSPKVYVLNTESALFHYSDCELVPQINPDYYATMTADRSAVTGRGYDPCSVCNP